MRRSLCVLLPVLLCGCSGRQVPPPALSPSGAAQQALTAYDSNGDGALDAKELDRCPALKKAAAKFDRDSDGRLTAAEISDRLQSYISSGVGLTSVTVEVYLDDKPLEGAEVTMTPEEFLGPAIKRATGTTDESGAASPQAEGEELPGMHCGLYRVTVSKKAANGKEMLPARYNSQSTLGEEVAPDMRGNITLRLSRR